MENKLTQYRDEINTIDTKLVELFTKRMEIAGDIAAYKKEQGLPVLDVKREREKLAAVEAEAGEAFSSYVGTLYSSIFALSRAYQAKLMEPESPLYDTILAARHEMENCEFPQKATVACQGVEGAYAQMACDRMLQRADILYFNSFDGVFSAIEKGLCRYGVLPIENSTAGSVNQVYDKMRAHNFYIVKSTRIKVDHTLLAKKGAKKSDIREIFTHEQAIRQCSGFLSALGPDIRVTPCENTAMAAKMVAESERSDVAALSARHCAALYGLSCLEEAVQDSGNNYTRFICISRKLEIYPGADKTSIMMVLPHEPGALYKVLSCFYSLGINLVKLESRPMPERNFEFMFYFDLETSIYGEAFAQLVCALEKMSEEFRYLGSYTETI